MSCRLFFYIIHTPIQKQYILRYTRHAPEFYSSSIIPGSSTRVLLRLFFSEVNKGSPSSINTRSGDQQAGPSAQRADRPDTRHPVNRLVWSMIYMYILSCGMPCLLCVETAVNAYWILPIYFLYSYWLVVLRTPYHRAHSTRVAVAADYSSSSSSSMDCDVRTVSARPIATDLLCPMWCVQVRPAAAAAAAIQHSYNIRSTFI